MFTPVTDIGGVFGRRRRPGVASAAFAFDPVGFAPTYHLIYGSPGRSLALEMGYKLAFEASSDHISTHMSYANVLTTGIDRASLLDAFQKRHVYGATDNILAEFWSGSHIMGDEFSTSSKPELKLRLTGTAPFAKVLVIRDGKYVYSMEPKTNKVSFTWRDTAPVSGKESYYYVRGEQADGEIVWVSPMWIKYTGN